MSEHQANEAALARLGALLAQKQARPTCLSCKFCVWNQQSAAQGMGECWYGPPAAFPVQGSNGQTGKMSVAPPVQLTKTWCSHHVEEVIQLAKPSALTALGGAKP